MALGETLREFGVKVSLNWDAKKFEEAQKKVDKFGDKLKGFAFEVAGTAAGLFGVGKAATFYARNIQNQADLLGITTEALQDYGYAAKVAADVNQDELNGSLQTLADTMDKARAGNLEARQSLMQIGAAGGNADAILSRLADPTYKVTDAFNDLSKGIEHLATVNPRAASRLTEMTTGNAKLFNLLKLGPKAIGDLTAEGQKNAAVSAKMIAAGNKLDIQLSKIYAIFRKFGVEIGIVTMSKLMPLINQFTKWFAKNKELIASGIVEFVKDFAMGMRILFDTVVAISGALSPFIRMVGGAENAIKILVAAFIGFKAVSIASSFVEMGMAIFKFLGPVTQLGTVLRGLGSAFKVFGMIEGLADILPALELFGSGALAALAPLLPVILGIAAAGVAIHDLMTLLSGGSFKDTWTGKGWDKVKEGVGWVGDKLSGINVAGAAPYGQIAPAGGAALAAANAPAPVSQQNTFQTNTTVTIGAGTSASHGAAMVQKGIQDAHEQLMNKAKQDAATTRNY